MAAKTTDPLLERRFDAVLLDRDGVINVERGDFVYRPSLWAPCHGSAGAIADLNRVGLKVGVCTNQSAVGRGLMSLSELDAVHAHMHRLLAEERAHVDALYACTHSPSVSCRCRKPAPGLLHRTLADFGTPPHRACFIGDSLIDLEAARAAKCVPILVRTGKGAQIETRARERGYDRIFDDLRNAVDWVLSC